MLCGVLLITARKGNYPTKMCCCDHRTHVKVIGILYLVFLALSLIVVIATILNAVEVKEAYENYEDVEKSYAIALGLEIPWFVFSVISVVLCLMGAFKNNKCFLIPFIVLQCLNILIFIGLGILFIYLGTVTVSIGGSIGGGFGGIVASWGSAFFVLLIPVLIGLGMSIYFLVIVVKFFQELSMGIVAYP